MTDLDRPWKRLKACRIAAGFPTIKSFTDAQGINYASYRTHENPTRAEGGKGRKFTQATAETYAGLFRERHLDVDAEWLLWGAGEPPVGVLGGPAIAVAGSHLRDGNEARMTIDRDLMARVVEAAESYLIDAALTVDPSRKGELFLALYELVEREPARTADEPIDISRYDNVFRLVAR